MKLKKYLSLFLLMFSFLFIIEVNAAETGDLGDYHYSESNSSSDYLKLELSDGKIVLIQFDCHVLLMEQLLIVKQDIYLFRGDLIAFIMSAQIIFLSLQEGILLQ